MVLKKVIVLFVLALLSIQGAVASARALSAAEVATLRDSAGDPRLPGWRTANALAEALGKEQNLDALPLLLELRSSLLMHSFVEGYRNVAGRKPPASELEALALKLARDPSFASDEGGWATRAEFFQLLGNRYRSRELFDLFYASVKQELMLTRKAPFTYLPPARRSLGGSVFPSGLTGIEEPIAALIPLLNDACRGYVYISFLRDRQYRPATDRLIALYLRTPIKPQQCAQDVAWTLASFHTRSANQGIVTRIHWLLDQPQSEQRDEELLSAIQTLGDQPVEAQVDLGALESEVLARAGTPSLQPKLQNLFSLQTDYARRAQTFDVDSLAFFIRRDDAAVVRSLLDHHVDANGVDRQGATPLVDAACMGNFDIVRMLVEAGAEVNRPSASGSLPLEMRCNGDAIAAGVDDERGAIITQYLLARGARINATDRMGFTALQVAAYAGNVKVMGLLLDHGAHINAPKRRAVRSDGTPEPRDTSAGWAPIHFAALHFAQGFDPPAGSGKLPAIKFLLDRGANINARAADGTTALLLATAYRDQRLAQFLVQRGADVNLAAEGGITPIIMAHELGHSQTVALLRSKGAVMNPLVLAKIALIRAWAHLYASP